MNSSPKKLLRNAPGYYLFKNWQNRNKQRSALRKWVRDGMPSPPPHLVKQRAIREFAEKYGIGILVETGTYYGDMVEAMKRHFRRIYSIELDEQLYLTACDRFRRDSQVTIIQGDSAEQLRSIVDKLDEPALFWLDGHFSGGVTARGAKDTPVIEELGYILDSAIKGHVILIDDARCFGSDPNYPTYSEIETYIRARLPDAEISMENDSIRIAPAADSSA